VGVRQPRRVAGGGGVDSMLQFWLERGGGEMKCYQKMKQRQRAHLGSMERKRDTAWQHDGMTMLVRGEVAPGRGKRGVDASWAYTNLTGQKMKKIYVVDSAATNVQ
jgi:hypothetical protein